MPVSMRFHAELWDTVPGTQVLKVVEGFLARGIDVRASLPDFGMSREIRPDSAIALRNAVSWLESVLATHPHRGLGLVCAGLSNILDAGLIAYVVLSSETVGEAIAERMRFTALLRPPFGISVQEQDDGLVEIALIEVDPPFLGPLARAFAMERELASWSGSWRSLVGSRFEAVHCAYPDPRLPEPYREVFGCPVRFDAPRSRVLVRSDLFDQPMRHPHAEAHRAVVEQCELLLARMRQGGGVAAALKRLLLKRPGRGIALAEAARGLALSGRTLERRLAEEGTSFSAVLLEVRMTLAGDYLRATPIEIADIGRLLGYRDESSFVRAFRRSYGMTPRAWRLQEGEGIRHAESGRAFCSGPKLV
jgi:AraC-like DNA-binding protein